MGKNFKMDLLEDLKMPFLSFIFVMTYLIYKMLVLLKNYLSYLKDSILECFFKEYNGLLFCFILLLFFSQYIMMESLSLEG